MKKQSKLSSLGGNQQTVIGIDLGDIKHAICVMGKNGDVIEESHVANKEQALQVLVAKYPRSLVAMEVGTHSPWISRLLKEQGVEVIVANARKLRAIYENERKSDALDARMLAKLARLDPQLLHPVEHKSELAQRDQLLIKLRDTLVRQRVNLVPRFALRSSLWGYGFVLAVVCVLVAMPESYLINTLSCAMG